MNLKEYCIVNGIGDITQIPLFVKSIFLEKGDMVTTLGTVEGKLYFINSGLIEAYMVKDNLENIIDFILPHTFCSAYTSLITQTPADVYHVCITHCKLEVIDYLQLKELCKTSITANLLYNHILEKQYVLRVKKEKNMLVNNNEQLYIDLLEQNPDILKEVPVAHIAKFIGVHPNSLSRIRKRVVEKK